jgi:hypothetical protein
MGRKQRRLRLQRVKNMFSKHSWDTKVETAYIPPRILLAQDVAKDQSILTSLVHTEIGFLGIVRRDLAANTILVERIMLFEQEVHASTTEISPGGVGKVMHELISSAADPAAGVDQVNRMLYWYHSHVNGAVSPSGQDEDQMKLFKDNRSPYFLRAIGNKQGNLRIDFFDYAHGIIVRDIPWSIEGENDEARTKYWQDEIAAKVKAKTYSVTNPYSFRGDDVGPDWHYRGFNPPPALTEARQAEFEKFQGPITPGDRNHTAEARRDGLNIWVRCIHCRKQVRVNEAMLRKSIVCPYDSVCGVRDYMVLESQWSAYVVHSYKQKSEASLIKPVDTQKTDALSDTTVVVPGETEVLTHEESFCPRDSSPPSEIVVSKAFDKDGGYPSLEEVLDKEAEGTPSKSSPPVVTDNPDSVRSQFFPEGEWAEG